MWHKSNFTEHKELTLVSFSSKRAEVIKSIYENTVNSSGHRYTGLTHNESNPEDWGAGL